jgi:hypothetical protein
MSKKSAVIPQGKIEQRILLIRGEKVIIDADLAVFYGVPTRRLNEQIKRNKKRFPKDFMFQLNADEKAEVVAICDHLSRLKYSKALPYAFTEHGAIMAASVLNSAPAVEMSVFIVRAFVRLRQTIAEHKEIAGKLQKLERRIAEHDEQILTLLEAIHQLMAPPDQQQKKIGFTIKERKASYGKKTTKKHASQKTQ